MKKVELLAPAGSMEALYAAIQNGCDAVYLGGEMFGARAFAHNFSKEDLKKAVTYAHIYGVQVYVTVNTLIKEEEVNEILSYISYLQEIDVDALIVQDLGLLSLLRTGFPDMEVHASTQMHVHNPQGITFLKEQGVKRVVVPRETAIEEIEAYAKLGIDLEVFVQGALCVSYSGQCLMSSVLFDRSGNRGACAQPCRMQYGLYRQEDGKEHAVPSKGDYLLSPKDLNTLEILPALIDAGVASFKIEGRMKRPEYVACMVSLYRKAIDAHLQHQTFKVTPQMLEDMQKLFHRGFTTGHIQHQMGSALMNPIRPNHIGIEIGKIIKISKDKMAIRLSKPLDQGDGIRILHDKEDEGFRVNKIYKNGLLINHGDAGDVIELDRIYGIKEQASVLKTSAVHQLKQLQESYQGYQRRIKISASFTMIKEQVPYLCVWDEKGNSVQMEGECHVEQAQKTPLSIERIQHQLRKTKDTPYDIIDIVLTCDEDAIMPIKEVNRMRRCALDALSERRAVRHKERSVMTPQASEISVEKRKGLYAIVHTYEQYLACKDQNVKIYVDGLILYQRIVKENPDVILRTSRIMKQGYPAKDALIQDIGGLKEGFSNMYDTSLNVYNSYAAQYLFEHQADVVICSLELDQEACIQLVEEYHQRNASGNFGYVVYGRRELMVSEYCPINAVEKDSDKKYCGSCKMHEYVLIDKKNRKFPLWMDEDCRMHLLEEEPMNRIEDMRTLAKHGIENFFCVFTKETQGETSQILHRIRSQYEY